MAQFFVLCQQLLSGLCILIADGDAAPNIVQPPLHRYKDVAGNQLERSAREAGNIAGKQQHNTENRQYYQQILTWDAGISSSLHILPLLFEYPCLWCVAETSVLLIREHQMQAVGR